MKSTLLILVFATILFSCKKTETKKIETTTINSKIKIDDFQDTIVNIVSKKTIVNQNVINDKTATKTLNAYFKSKGFLIQSEINEDLNIPRLPKNKGKNVIEFSEIMLFNNQLGVISYYNAKPNAIGHCVQPHKAIISNSEKGLVISDEDFLPNNFTIDSVKTIENNYIIYSDDYNCYHNKSLKKYRIKLK